MRLIEILFQSDCIFSKAFDGFCQATVTYKHYLLGYLRYHYSLPRIPHDGLHKRFELFQFEYITNNNEYTIYRYHHLGWRSYHRQLLEKQRIRRILPWLRAIRSCVREAGIIKMFQ